YLVALAVGDLDVVEAPPIPPNGKRKTPLPLRGIAAHGKGADLAYALENTGALLAPLENYFDQPYPYSKLDIIAVPDFQSGAMENAGAITFRERLLLLKPDAPVTQRQAYASVMAHELAHMWFGDLVTMPWWDDIWLNESFATWMSYKAVREFDPGARPELRRLGRLRRAKMEDGLRSARQIREPVTDHHGIVAAFDGITYAKGGAVLNMIEHYLGEDTFRTAVRDHMERFAWGSADVNDFIASLVRASEPVIETSFKSFLFQNGLPRVAQSAPCNEGKMTLSQARYLPIGTANTDAQTWTFPVCMKYGSGGEVHQQCNWMSKREVDVSFANDTCPDWITLDADFAGYYHWAVDDDVYTALHSATESLSESDWESVIDSVYAGLTDGSLSVGTAWRTLQPLAASPYRSVAVAPVRALTYWLDKFGDEPKMAASLRRTGVALYENLDPARAFDPVFIDGQKTDEDRVFFQQVARFMAVVARDASTRLTALKHVQSALSEEGVDTTKLASLTLETALVVAVQDGDEALRKRLQQAFATSRDAQFRKAALNALGSTRDDALAASLRDQALEGLVRRNEIQRLLAAQFREPNARNGAWRFVRDHYDELTAMMPPRHAAQLPARLSPFCDAVMLDPMEALFRPHVNDVPGGERLLNKALEAMSQCAARATGERSAVRELFAPGIRR
ncbi:MAG: M1 family aminopeptidase, partial [Gammaproteobacteria bacterium]